MYLVLIYHLCLPVTCLFFLSNKVCLVQISVQCTERGHLLALLRQKYVGLLDRIPKEVKGLNRAKYAIFM